MSVILHGGSLAQIRRGHQECIPGNKSSIHPYVSPSTIRLLCLPTTHSLMCGGGVHSIWLLPLVAICLGTIDVCIWRMFVSMSVVVTVWGSVGMFFV